VKLDFKNPPVKKLEVETQSGETLTFVIKRIPYNKSKEVQKEISLLQEGLKKKKIEFPEFVEGSILAFTDGVSKEKLQGADFTFAELHEILEAVRGLIEEKASEDRPQKKNHSDQDLITSEPSEQESAIEN
jgi:glycine cleavage system protein P-like pyridoxal-binding family